MTSTAQSCPLTSGSHGLVQAICGSVASFGRVPGENLSTDRGNDSHIQALGCVPTTASATAVDDGPLGC